MLRGKCYFHRGHAPDSSVIQPSPGWFIGLVPTNSHRVAERFGRTYSELRHRQFPGSNSLAVGLAAPNQRRDARQGREGRFGVFQPKTWADGDNFTCFGGRRLCEGIIRRRARP